MTDQQNHAAFDRIIALLDQPTPALAAALAQQNEPEPHVDYTAILARF